MKKVLHPLMILFVLIALSLHISCGIFTPLDPELKVRKDAWDTIIEAHIAKQLWFYDFFRIYSNNYARGQLFIYEPSKAQIDFLIKEYENLMSYADAVQVAVDSLKFSGNSAFSKVSANTGIISSLVDFFIDGAEVKTNNRKRILLIASNMNKMERDQLYEELVINKWKRQIGSADDFWTKLENGDLDDKASTLFKNFYDGANLYLNPFTQLANDKNLTPGKMLAKDGINLCEKGMDVVVESGKMIIPGLDKATDLLESGKDYYEKVEKMVDKPMDAVVDEIKSRAAGKLAGMIDIDSRLDSEGAGKYVKLVAELTLGSDDPQELIEKGIDAGIARIGSPDNSIKPDIIIAENRQPDSGLPDYIFGIGNYVKRANAYIMTLPSGNWNISAHENTGQVSLPVVTTVTGQQDNTVDVVLKTNEQNSAHFDSVLTALHKMIDMHILVYDGSTKKLDIPGQPLGLQVSFSDSINWVKWAGTSFSQDMNYKDSTWDFSVEIDGNITLFSYDKAGINLTATRTLDYYLESGQLRYQVRDEISVTGFPLSVAWTLTSHVEFEISPSSNNDLLNTLENYVTYSSETTHYDGDNISQINTRTGFTQLSQSMVRIKFFDYLVR